MKKPLIVLAIVIGVIGLAVINSFRGGAEEKRVETVVLGEQIIEASILASGTLTHEQEVRLTSEEIGKVKSLYVEEGDKVTKGQLVLEIDDEDHIAAVEQSQAAVRMQEIAIERARLRVENLDKQIERKRALFQKNLLDEDSFENLTHELALAKIDLDSNKESLVQRQAQLEQSQTRLAKTKVYAPIDGVVTSLDIEEGETAIAGTTNIEGSSLMTIADPASIQTEVYVDEADVANVAVGQRAEVVAIAYPDDPVSGEVTSVAVSAKQARGQQGLSFAVKIKVDHNDNVVLRPGMSCRAEIFTHGQQKVTAIPIKAITVEEDRSANEIRYFVFVSRNGKAERVEVKTGISDDEFQEIKEGLQLGDEVVVGPDAVLRHLVDGDNIEAVGADLPG
jgi:HlyD family secretion protein